MRLPGHIFILCQSPFLILLWSDFLADGSDCQQTDVEDQWNNKSKSRGSERAESSKPGLNQQPGPENPANPSLMPAAHEISPIYIINNMVPKQVRQV